MTRTLPLCQRLCLLVVAGSLPAATPPPERLLPADTLAFVTAPSWEAFRAAWQQNALGQLWADPAMRPFREKFHARFKREVVEPIEKELGLNLTNYATLLQGQITLALLPAPADASGAPQYRFLFIGDTGARQTQLTTNLVAWRKKWADAGRTHRTTRIRDLEFTTVTFVPAEVRRALEKILPDSALARAVEAPATEKKNTTAEWTLGQSGPLLLVSDAPGPLEKLLVLQSGGGLPALADQAAFAAHAPQFRQAQLYGWANLKAMFEHSLKGAPSAAAAEPDPATEARTRLLDATGLASLQTLAFHAQQSAAGTLVTLRITAPESARKGLFKVLHFAARDASPLPFVPAEVVKFSRVRADLPKLWNNLEGLLGETLPPLANVLKFMIATAGKEQDPNFDLRQSLIAQLGDDLLTFAKLPPTITTATLESPRSLLLIGARNADQVAAAFKTAATIIPPEITRLKEREFLGRTIYSLTWPGLPGSGARASGTPVTFAASGSYVAFSGDVALVEEHLRSSAGRTRALRERPGLAEAAQQVGGMSTGFFTYENTAESARAVFEAARHDSFNAAALLGGSWSGRLGVTKESGIVSWFDFTALPPFEQVAKYFHFNVSALTLGPDGYTLKLFAPMPPGLRK